MCLLKKSFEKINQTPIDLNFVWVFIQAMLYWDLLKTNRGNGEA
jgi:hypothetical protein